MTPLVGVEAFVGDHDVGLDVRQQDVRTVEIAGLSGREREADRIAQSREPPPLFDFSQPSACGFLTQ